MKVGLGACDEVSRICATRTKNHQNLWSTVQSEQSDCQGNTGLKEASGDVDRAMRRSFKGVMMKMMAVKLKKVLGTHRICNKIQTNE